MATIKYKNKVTYFTDNVLKTYDQLELVFPKLRNPNYFKTNTLPNKVQTTKIRKHGK